MLIYTRNNMYILPIYNIKKRVPGWRFRQAKNGSQGGVSSGVMKVRQTPDLNTSQKQQ